MSDSFEKISDNIGNFGRRLGNPASKKTLILRKLDRSEKSLECQKNQTKSAKIGSNPELILGNEFW